MPQLSVVIPAYNEEKRLARTLSAVGEFVVRHNIDAEVIVVDDGSSDGTTAVARSFPNVQALRYETNRGKGYAVRHGVLRATGERVLFMDADLATPLDEFFKLQSALDADPSVGVAIGSRPLAESELLVRQPPLREMAGRLFNRVVQFLATPGISDTQCGFKLFTRESARQIFSRCVLDGFSFDVETLFLARKLGVGIAEIPVRWAHQEGATAFATRAAYLKHGLKMLRDVSKIRWIHRAVRPSSSATSPVVGLSGKP